MLLKKYQDYLKKAIEDKYFNNGGFREL